MLTPFFSNYNLKIISVISTVIFLCSKSEKDVKSLQDKPFSKVKSFMLFSLGCDRLQDLELPFITTLDSANI